MTSFDISIQYVLANEGGYVYEALDKGGPTNMGITSRLLVDHRGGTILLDDVKHLTIEEAKEIYKKYFWIPLRLDLLDSQNIATAILDMAVNMGQARAIICAQNALNKEIISSIGIDGELGPKTREALNKINEKEFIMRFVDWVKNFYRNIVYQHPEEGLFLSGWMNRADRLLTLLD